MALIIVESPTKARTFNDILKKRGKSKDYFVFATMGHIRDLPSSNISVDYEHNFEPKYIIIKNKQKVVKELKSLAKKHKEIIFATDPDREGESISYHAAYILGFTEEAWPKLTYKKGKEPKRIIFHEITPEALEEALAHPETIRIPLVQAQRARRILDRLVGYELSPLLWKKMGKNWLSAGRVQTVALRLIVEREKEIRNFKQEEYFKINGIFKNGNPFSAKLTKKDDVPYEQRFKIELFSGTYTYTKTTITKNNLEPLVNDIKSDSYKIADVAESTQKRTPPPPFTTSLLQQESFQKHGYSAKMTMKLAQDLYEQGLITYHRTDSFTISAQFQKKLHTFIGKTYGNEYALTTPRVFTTKSKMAQEAHEAIRPTNLATTVETVSNPAITSSHLKVYKLIYDRTVASQMADAKIKTISIHILGTKGYLFTTSLQNVVFEGFLKVLNPEYITENQGSTDLKKGHVVTLQDLETTESISKGPPRFNEASLIRTLEEKGIGRPSTYAPIISLIQDKNYVEKEQRQFLPTQLGETISDYLAGAFPDLFGLTFTADMEDKLDHVAEDKESVVTLLKEFHTPFAKTLAERKSDTKKIDIEEKVDELCPKCKSQLVVRYSRYGKFIACSSFPDCKFTKPFLHVIDGKTCPMCNEGRIVVRFTKTKKRFYGCERYPDCTYSSWKLE